MDLNQTCIKHCKISDIFHHDWWHQLFKLLDQLENTQIFNSLTVWNYCKFTNKTYFIIFSDFFQIVIQNKSWDFYLDFRHVSFNLNLLPWAKFSWESFHTFAWNFTSFFAFFIFSMFSSNYINIYRTFGIWFEAEKCDNLLLLSQMKILVLVFLFYNLSPP